MVLILGLLVGIMCAIYINGDAKQRNMSSGWTVIALLFGLFALPIYLIARNQQVVIPQTCPHCKKPNTKGSRMCEWCGEVIY